MTSIYYLIAGISFVILAGLVVHLARKLSASKEQVGYLSDRYSHIINVDLEITQRKERLAEVIQQIEQLNAGYEKQKHELSTEYQVKYGLYEELLKEISIVESDLNDISYGLYKPVYNYETSDQYKAKLEEIRANEKSLIRDEKAVHCAVEWTVAGSRSQGVQMTKQYSKLMLRAFNGECDSAIARVSWNNIGNMETRLAKSYEAINKLGSVTQSSITKNYFDLKLAELRLEFELQEKIHAEKEEQRLIREQMREEERAQRELEQAQKRAADEETRYQKALDKARQEVEQATGTKLDGLNQKIEELEALLEKAKEQKARAMSMAQMTKSGHVYVISNIGSFGENVFKIGMTRRLEPLDRVRELGDASVPFSFDVHGLVYSDNAPELENIIHKRLMDQRVNLINNRREFFFADINKIEQIFKDAGVSLTLTKLAEAREYRESISIRDSQQNSKEGRSPLSIIIPNSLN